MYDNPENIGISEILRIQRSNMKIGPNRNKRFQTVSNYSTDLISKEEWIKKYCI
jgi:hypothetical protein